MIHLMLEKMGHKQPLTPVHCEHSTAVDIGNDTMNYQQSRSTEMRFFWMVDQGFLEAFGVQWQPGQKNLADYFTKHFAGQHHQIVRTWYLHGDSSPIYLPRAVASNALQGWVGRLLNGYS